MTDPIPQDDLVARLLATSNHPADMKNEAAARIIALEGALASACRCFETIAEKETDPHKSALAGSIALTFRDVLTPIPSCEEG